MESTVCSDRKLLANAVGAKSARACDNCIKRRAGWYCAADDAFLCQSCDNSVHSANPLARRHERVRLKASPSPSVIKEDDDEKPTWHQGFTRKARTPRQHSSSRKRPAAAASFSCEPAVPEINNCSDENSGDEQLLYRVPVFEHPFVSGRAESKPAAASFSMSHFLPTEMDLAEFAADVESLLGNGLDSEAVFDMEGLGILGDEKSMRVKVEEDEGVIINNNNNQFGGGDGEFIDMGRESFVLNFDFDDSPVLGGEEEEDNKNINTTATTSNNNNNNTKKILLRLDYEGVMSAWDDQRSPWTTGERPDSSDCWPDCAGSKLVHGYGGMMSTHNSHASSSTVMADGGREARVSRYREKRRTRLFSKKIRYEVRKLNAEKRPRMKGRFVKRPHFATATS